MENKSADEIVKSSIKTGGFPSDILEYLVELETEKLRLSQDKGDLNYADLLERLKTLENDVKFLKNEATPVIQDVEEKHRTISVESNTSKATSSSMFGPSRKWFDYSSQRTNSKEKESTSIPASNSTEALPSVTQSSYTPNGKKATENKQNLIQPLYTLPNALLSYDTKSRAGRKEVFENSSSSLENNNKMSWASQMSMSKVLGGSGNGNNKERRMDMKNITDKFSVNIPKDFYGLNNRSAIYGQQQIIKNQSQLNNRRRSATDVSLSKHSTHSNHSSAYPDSRNQQNNSPKSSLPSASHTPSKSSIHSRGDRAGLDTDTVCSEIIPEGNENILEFCIVEADWSALVKDDVLLMSSLLPSREQFRYPVPEDNQADTNTQLIQSQNFFFPSGVQIDFVAPSAVPLYTKKCNYKRHIVPFMDTQGTPTYACCLTVTQAYSYEEIQQIDSKIVPNLVEMNRMKQAVVCIQKAYRQYTLRMKEKILSTLTNATHTHGGITSSSSFSDSFSKVWSKSVTGLISSAPGNKSAPTVQQSANQHTKQQQQATQQVTQTSMHSTTAVLAAVQQTQSSGHTTTTSGNNAGHNAQGHAVGSGTTATHSTQSAGFFSKLFRGTSTTSEESDPNHNSGQSVSSLNAAITSTATAANTAVITTVTTTATTTVTATTTTVTEVTEQSVPLQAVSEQQSVTSQAATVATVVNTQAPATPAKDSPASNTAPNTKAMTPIVPVKTSTSSLFFGRSKAAVVEQPQPTTPAATPSAPTTNTSNASTTTATGATASAGTTASSTATSVAYSFYKSLPGLSATHSPVKVPPVVQPVVQPVSPPAQQEPTQNETVMATAESGSAEAAANTAGDESAELAVAVDSSATTGNVVVLVTAEDGKLQAATTANLALPDAPLASPLISQPMSPLSPTSPLGLHGTGGSVVPEVNKEMLLYLLMMSQLEAHELNDLHSLIVNFTNRGTTTATVSARAEKSVGDGADIKSEANIVSANSNSKTSETTVPVDSLTNTAIDTAAADTTVHDTEEESPAVAIKEHIITLLNSNTLGATDIDEILSAITELIEDDTDDTNEKDEKDEKVEFYEPNSPMSMDSNRSSFSGKSSSRNSINRNSIAEMTAQFTAELAAQKAIAAAQAAELVAKLEERRHLNELEHNFRTNRVVVAQKAYCIITSVAEYTFIFKVLDAIADAETNMSEQVSKPPLSESDNSTHETVHITNNSNSNSSDSRDNNKIENTSLTLNLTPLVVHTKRESNRLTFLDSVQSYMLDYYCGDHNNIGSNNINSSSGINNNTSSQGCAYEHGNSTLTTTNTHCNHHNHNNSNNNNNNTANKNTHKNKNSSVTQVEVANQFLNKYVFNSSVTANSANKSDGSLAYSDRHSKQGTPNSNWTTPAQQISSPSKTSLSRKYSKKVLTKSNSNSNSSNSYSSSNISPLNRANTTGNNNNNNDNGNNSHKMTFSSVDSYDHSVTSETVAVVTTDIDIHSEVTTHQIDQNPTEQTTQTTQTVEIVQNTAEQTSTEVTTTEIVTNKTQPYQINVPEYIESFVIDRASLLTTKEWSCAVLFAHLNADVVFKIINLLLMETSLIIYGKNPGIVTTITLAVINLINPFIWEGIFVPLIPDNARELFGAPVPFILGTISPPRIADVAAATAILYLNDDIVLQVVPPPPVALAPVKPVKPCKPPKPVKSDSSLVKTVSSDSSAEQPAVATVTPNTTPVKPATPAKLVKATKTETEAGLQETAAAAVAELTSLTNTAAEAAITNTTSPVQDTTEPAASAITSAESVETPKTVQEVPVSAAADVVVKTDATTEAAVGTTAVGTTAVGTTAGAVTASVANATSADATSAKEEAKEAVKSEFLAWFVRLPEIADMPIDEEILRRIEYVRQQLCAFYIPKLEFLDTKSNKNGLFAPKVDFSLPDIAETVITDATESTITTLNVRNNMDSLLMCDVPSNILKQVQVLITAIERSNFNFCGREIKNAANWRKFLKYSHTSGEEEFCPEYFIEPLRMNLKFQEAMVSTQLFVAYMDTVKRVQETLDYVRMFIAEWIYKRMEIKKTQHKQATHDTSAQQVSQHKIL